MSETVSQIVSIVPMGKALYMLFVEYEEGDGGNGVGYIYRTDGSREPELEAVLSTNDILRSMWGSPGGALWTASEDGNVWTSAKVQWSKPRYDDLDSLSHDPALTWTVTTLPDLRDEGYAPTLGALWGTGDADVFAAASGGHIYQWDGKTWRQTYTAAGDVRAFTGTGPGDVYAVGERQTLLHYDGNAWTPMRSPAGGTDYETFTACCMAPDDTLLVSSQQGRLLHGSVGGLTVLAQNEDLQLMGVAMLDARVMMAAGRAGVVELQNNALAVARDTFYAVCVIPGGSKLYFLDALSEPTYVEYDPAHPQVQWARITF